MRSWSYYTVHDNIWKHLHLTNQGHCFKGAVSINTLFKMWLQCAKEICTLCWMELSGVLQIWPPTDELHVQMKLIRKAQMGRSLQNLLDRWQTTNKDRPLNTEEDSSLHFCGLNLSEIMDVYLKWGLLLVWMSDIYIVHSACVLFFLIHSLYLIYFLLYTTLIKIWRPVGKLQTLPFSLL